MAIRTPQPLNTESEFDAVFEHFLKKEPKALTAKYQVELITPMVGGGIDKGSVDLHHPIRAQGINYQLRFWWRVLKSLQAQENELNKKWKKIQQQEKYLFGWRAGADQVQPCRSRVFLSICEVEGTDKIIGFKWATSAQQELLNSYRDNIDGLLGEVLLFNEYHAIRSKRQKKFINKNCKDALSSTSRYLMEFIKDSFLIKEGLKFSLNLTVPAHTGENDETLKTEFEDLKTAIQLWANFGGLGARTRRGFGAIAVSDANNNLLPVFKAQDTLYTTWLKDDLSVSRSTFPEILPAHFRGIRKLFNFRQGELGRDIYWNRPPMSRYDQSHWPEPATVRNLAGHHINGHEASHDAGLLFPRAAFGMPIKIQFKPDQAVDAEPYTKPNGKTGYKRTTENITKAGGDPLGIIKQLPTSNFGSAR